jgi:pimeloyl-ACP methyl ester carboxylesterase
MTLFTLASLLLAPAAIAGAPQAPSADGLKKAGDTRIENYSVKAPSGQDIDAELWHLAVPENRQKPASPLIEIAFVRLKSTAKQPGPPLVFLAGGPGSSGTDEAKGRGLPLFLSLRDAGDVILLDQRGIGKCRPVLSSAITWELPPGPAHIKLIELSGLP